MHANSLVALGVSAIASVVSAQQQQQQQLAQISRIVSFGDDLSDTGNLLTLTKGAYPGTPYFQGRFTNGPNWIDYLTWSLGNSTSKTIELKSYANSASITNNTLAIASRKAEVAKYPDLFTQLNSFIADDANRTTTSADTLFTVSATLHDYLEPFDHNDYPDLVGGVNSITNFVKGLVNAKAKNIVLLNYPPFDLIPRTIYLANHTNSKRYPKMVQGLSNSANVLLSKAMGEIVSTSNVNIALVDLNTIVKDAAADPTYKNVHEPCYKNGPVKVDAAQAAFTTASFPAPEICADPENHLFFDAVHFSTKVHKNITDKLVEMVKNGNTGLISSPVVSSTPVIITTTDSTRKPSSAIVNAAFGLIPFVFPALSLFL
ncbi:hypothetical protein HDU97_006912 [Phlyctochytrium planicorne]|nr:hypothetical protein HDU97_006912 [Phlyctochytrium planicorne]